jgi:hypothetical protein
MNGHTLLPESRTEAGSRFWRYLLPIIAAKVIIEMIFFIGVAAQYGEESIFVALALPSKEAGVTYWSSISHFSCVADWAKWTGDPSDMYPFRISALYPNILFMKMFGASETSLMLWSAITGVGTVLLVALIGRSLAGAAVGLFSASVLSLIPGHILYSARVDTDMPQLFFMSLGAFFLILALQATMRRKQLAFAAASGLSFGLLYLAKLPPAFLALAWALLAAFVLAVLGDRETLSAPGSKLRQATLISTVMLGGFALVFAAENCAYYHLSGHWFLHFHIMKGNAVNLGSWRGPDFVTKGFLKIWLPQGGWRDFFAHARMFGESLSAPVEVGDVYTMPIHGWSAAAFLPAFLVLPFLRIKHRRLSLLLIFGFVFYYLYQEIFWLYPTIEGGELNLTFVHKVYRFVFPCYIGISLCVGLALGALWQHGVQSPGRWTGRIFRWASVCLVLAFAAANYPSVRFYHAYMRGSLADLRQACSDLKAIAPDGARIFIVAGSEPFYRVFQYPRHYELKYFVDDREENVRDGWAVVGGFLGIGASPEGFAEGYSEWLRPYYRGQAGPPPHWQLVHTRPSPQDPNSPFLRILKLPE